jgi:hypothetical protein
MTSIMFGVALIVLAVLWPFVVGNAFNDRGSNADFHRWRSSDCREGTPMILRPRLDIRRIEGKLTIVGKNQSVRMMLEKASRNEKAPELEPRITGVEKRVPLARRLREAMNR